MLYILIGVMVTQATRPPTPPQGHQLGAASLTSAATTPLSVGAAECPVTSLAPALLPASPE